MSVATVVEERWWFLNLPLLGTSAFSLIRTILASKRWKLFLYLPIAKANLVIPASSVSPHVTLLIHLGVIASFTSLRILIKDANLFMSRPMNSLGLMGRVSLLGLSAAGVVEERLDMNLLSCSCLEVSCVYVCLIDD